jgi:hypothetical protein
MQIVNVNANRPARGGFPTRLFPYTVLFNALLSIPAVMMAGDMLVAGRPDGPLQRFWPLTDSPVHAALALLVVSPLLRRAPRRRRAAWLAVAGLAAVLVDLDHAAAARSFSVYAMTHLNGRPETHSLLFAVGAGLLASRLGRNPLAGWLVGLALASHVLRDAVTGGTPYLWPLPVKSLPAAVYYAAQAGLYLAACALGWAGRPFSGDRA